MLGEAMVTKLFTQPHNQLIIKSVLYSPCIDRAKSQHCDRQTQKALGRQHRMKFFKRPRHKANRRTARQLQFKGRSLILWNEDVNRLGKLDPQLAMKVSVYAWAETDAKRAEYKIAFWNGQKGNMKRDFERASDILIAIHGGTLSAEGRPFINWN